MTIKEARNEKQMTQAELASAVGVSVCSVQNWERGTASPMTRHQRRIREVLGIDLRLEKTQGVA